MVRRWGKMMLGGESVKGWPEIEVAEVAVVEGRFLGTTRGKILGMNPD
jgi:hypothetical protein